METKIIDALRRPDELERLYRTDKEAFKREFDTVYGQIKQEPIAQFWNERLNYPSDESNWGTGRELAGLVLIALLAGLLAKIPAFFGVDEEFFYPRNISFLVFPILTGYFLWKNGHGLRSILVISFLVLGALAYINFMPLGEYQTLVLTCLHMPIFLYFLTGYAFVGKNFKDIWQRTRYLRFNGELIVMVAVILLAGGLFSGITVSLFNLLEVDIDLYYFNYVGIFGLAAAPIVATFLIEKNPQLVNRVSPVIAHVFSPLVLITLLVFLVSFLTVGKNPFTDRDFLLVLNMLLVGVLAIIFFSVSATSTKPMKRLFVSVLFSIAVLATIINAIALSAIIFRISEWGFTPNRTAVIGSNLLILANVLTINVRLFQSLKSPDKIHLVNRSIAAFLPIYCFWAAFVAFLFPFIFNFR